MINGILPKSNALFLLFLTLYIDKINAKKVAFCRNCFQKNPTPASGRHRSPFGWQNIDLYYTAQRTQKQALKTVSSFFSILHKIGKKFGDTSVFFSYETVKKYYLFYVIIVVMNRICSGLWTKSEQGLSSKYWMPHETIKFIMLFQYD